MGHDNLFTYTLFFRSYSHLTFIHFLILIHLWAIFFSAYMQYFHIIYIHTYTHIPALAHTITYILLFIHFGGFNNEMYVLVSTSRFFHNQVPVGLRVGYPSHSHLLRFHITATSPAPLKRFAPTHSVPHTPCTLLDTGPLWPRLPWHHLSFPLLAFLSDTYKDNSSDDDDDVN